MKRGALQIEPAYETAVRRVNGYGSPHRAAFDVRLRRASMQAVTLVWRTGGGDASRIQPGCIMLETCRS
ncbi:predicted protein [Plenodomus lingam JN3]|uniref:Predicted protein n=1 Tax=Leptosphaeria maculans (strain JN3 / isolate v23.1.3 / race Av1-4-5-6-7-8) TaxID=985895 RepID=E5ABS5_LEPMJ|nr:predicted protein [Plenodomus lingam JN3]CBY01116.1 predicted protein [Plenodomus lingam JN3]